MNFYDILSEQGCIPHLEGHTRDEVLRELADHAATLPALSTLSADTLYDGLRTREEQGSTGIGDGIGIPHARFKEVDQFVLLIATSRKGVDFDAMDHKKVKVFFLLIGPDGAVREHLKLLAGISSILARSNLFRQLEIATTPTAMFEAFISRTTDAEAVKPKEALKLLTLVLYEEEFFYDILEFFLEEGIEGATILESSGMGQYISNIPLFASFIGFMNEHRNRSRTILATVPESKVDTLVKGIEDITGDLDKTQGAMILVVDVALSKGTMKMM